MKKTRLLQIVAIMMALILMLSLGLAGCDAGGLSGGDTGTDGVAGEQGAQGEKGEAGASGDTLVGGAQGEKGDAGADGIDGIDGTDGKDGIDGVDGADGKDGVDGQNGSGGQGAQGPRGATGAKGAQGEQGETGAQGPQGEPGIPGADGAPGSGPGSPAYVTEGQVSNLISSALVDFRSNLDTSLGSTYATIGALSQLQTDLSTNLSKINQNKTDITGLTNTVQSNTGSISSLRITVEDFTQTYGAAQSILQTQMSSTVLPTLTGNTEAISGNTTNISVLQSQVLGLTDSVLGNTTDIDELKAKVNQINTAAIRGTVANIQELEELSTDELEIGDAYIVQDDDIHTGAATIYGLIEGKEWAFFASLGADLGDYLTSEDAGNIYYTNAQASTALGNKADLSALTTLSGKFDLLNGKVTDTTTGISDKLDVAQVDIENLKTAVPAELSATLITLTEGVGLLRTDLTTATDRITPLETFKTNTELALTTTIPATYVATANLDSIFAGRLAGYAQSSNVYDKAGTEGLIATRLSTTLGTTNGLYLDASEFLSLRLADEANNGAINSSDYIKLRDLRTNASLTNDLAAKQNVLPLGTGSSGKALISDGSGSVSLRDITNQDSGTLNSDNSLVTAATVKYFLGLKADAVALTPITGDINGLKTGKQDKITGALEDILSSTLTGDKVLISSTGGKVGVSQVSVTELGYLSGLGGTVANKISGLSSELKGSGDTSYTTIAQLSGAVKSTQTGANGIADRTTALETLVGNSDSVGLRKAVKDAGDLATTLNSQINTGETGLAATVASLKSIVGPLESDGLRKAMSDAQTDITNIKDTYALTSALTGYATAESVLTLSQKVDAIGESVAVRGTVPTYGELPLPSNESYHQGDAFIVTNDEGNGGVEHGGATIYALNVSGSSREWVFISEFAAAPSLAGYVTTEALEAYSDTDTTNSTIDSKIEDGLGELNGHTTVDAIATLLQGKVVPKLSTQSSANGLAVSDYGLSLSPASASAAGAMSSADFIKLRDLYDKGTLDSLLQAASGADLSSMQGKLPATPNIYAGTGELGGVKATEISAAQLNKALAGFDADGSSITAQIAAINQSLETKLGSIEGTGVVTTSGGTLSASSVTKARLESNLSGLGDEAVIKDLIDAKQATIPASAAVSTVLAANLSANKILISDNNGKISASTVDKNQLSYLDGLSGDDSILTRLNGKMNAAVDSESGLRNNNGTLTLDLATTSKAGAMSAADKLAVNGITTSLDTKQNKLTGTGLVAVTNNSVDISSITRAQLEAWFNGLDVASLKTQLDAKQPKLTGTGLVTANNGTLEVSSTLSKSQLETWFAGLSGDSLKTQLDGKLPADAKVAGLSFVSNAITVADLQAVLLGTNFANYSGTLPIGKGGTGATTGNAAIAGLMGSNGTNGQVLKSNGNGTFSWGGADENVPSLINNDIRLNYQQLIPNNATFSGTPPTGSNWVLLAQMANSSPLSQGYATAFNYHTVGALTSADSQAGFSFDIEMKANLLIQVDIANDVVRDFGIRGVLPKGNYCLVLWRSALNYGDQFQLYYQNTSYNGWYYTCDALVANGKADAGALSVNQTVSRPYQANVSMPASRRYYPFTVS